MIKVTVSRLFAAQLVRHVAGRRRQIVNEKTESNEGGFGHDLENDQKSGTGTLFEVV